MMKHHIEVFPEGPAQQKELPAIDEKKRSILQRAWGLLARGAGTAQPKMEAPVVIHGAPVAPEALQTMPKKVKDDAVNLMYLYQNIPLSEKEDKSPLKGDTQTLLSESIGKIERTIARMQPFADQQMDGVPTIQELEDLRAFCVERKSALSLPSQLQEFQREADEVAGEVEKMHPADKNLRPLLKHIEQIAMNASALWKNGAKGDKALLAQLIELAGERKELTQTLKRSLKKLEELHKNSGVSRQNLEYRHRTEWIDETKAAVTRNLSA